MANTWGSLAWGIGNFGAQNDATVEVTGASLTSNLGTDTTIQTTVEFGWGRLAWGENAWGVEGDVVVTGQEMTAAQGSVTTQANADAFPTGQLLTISQGDENVTIATDIFTNSFPLTIAEGNLDADPDANITGIQLTANLGSPLAYNLEGWGRYVWGEYVWGATGIWANVDLTGIELTATAGTVSDFIGDANIQINDPTDAFSLLVQEGSLDPNPDANAVGVAMTAALSSVTPLADANVDLTGFAITSSLGTVVLVPSKEVDISGFALTMALNSVDYDADGFVELTGNSLTISEGRVYNLIWNEVDTGTVVPWTEVDTAA